MLEPNFQNFARALWAQPQVRQTALLAGILALTLIVIGSLSFGIVLMIILVNAGFLLYTREVLTRMEVTADGVALHVLKLKFPFNFEERVERTSFDQLYKIQYVTEDGQSAKVQVIRDSATDAFSEFQVQPAPYWRTQVEAAQQAQANPSARPEPTPKPPVAPPVEPEPEVSATPTSEDAHPINPFSIDSPDPEPEVKPQPERRAPDHPGE